MSQMGLLVWLFSQPSGRNGESRPSGNAVEIQRDLENAQREVGMLLAQHSRILLYFCLFGGICCISSFGERILPVKEVQHCCYHVITH